MTEYHYHFRSSSISPDEIDSRAEERGHESRSEYIRSLIREDLQRAMREDNR